MLEKLTFRNVTEMERINDRIGSSRVIVTAVSFETNPWKSRVQSFYRVQLLSLPMPLSFPLSLPLSLSGETKYLARNESLNVLLTANNRQTSCDVRLRFIRE